MNPNDIYQKAIKALGNIGQKVVNTPVLPFLPQSVNLKNIATRPPGTFTSLDPGSLYGNFQQDPKGAIMNTVMALSAAPVPAKSALSKISNMDRKIMGDFVEAIESGRAKQPLDELGVNAANIAKGLGVPETATNQTIANHFNNAIKAMDEQSIQPVIEPDSWKAAQKVVQNKPSIGGEIETLYRGEGSGGMGSKANGNYYSTDKEFAREFTRLMSDKEIKQIKVPKNAIYEPKELPFAGNEKEITQAINEARQKGFNAIRVSEGAEQPNSVFIIDPKKPISIPSSGGEIGGAEKYIANKLGGKVVDPDKIFAQVVGMPDVGNVPENFKTVVGRGSDIQLPNNRMALRLAEDNSKINVAGIAVEKTGGGSGTKAIEALKEYADKTGKELNVYKITNPKFFDKFDWLKKTQNGDYTYIPNSGEIPKRTK